jgi:BCD family chlorophyll transporter-like MFS transporter
MGVLAGVLGFSAIIFAGPLASANLFRFGTLWIGFGSGLFSVGTLIAAMALETRDRTGLALGAWGAAQASAAGVAIAAGGGLRDIISSLALHGDLGSALALPSTGYCTVYHVEIGLLFVTLICLGRLVRPVARASGTRFSSNQLSSFPS